MESLKEQVLQMMLERYPFLPTTKKYQGKWSYDFGVILMGIKEAYQETEDPQLFAYIKETLDYFIQEDGSIRNYTYESMNIDFVNNGKLLFLLYQKTGQEKYKLALDTLFEQLQHMPRTSEGGFWHKKIYPYQMWLDGLYMGAPFYAEYLLTFCDGAGLEDVLLQFELCYQHTLEQKTGLLYHAWDERKSQPWADPKTGQAPNFWGRAMGWYVLALSDTLSLLPKSSSEQQRLAVLLEKSLTALFKVQDPVKKVWYQVLDQGQRHGNYLEASASCMIVAAAAKALHTGALNATWKERIQESYAGLIAEFVLFTKEGWINLIRNCEVAGLGGDEERDGSFVYYVSEPIIANDFKGLGAFIQAVVAYEKLKMT